MPRKTKEVERFYTEMAANQLDFESMTREDLVDFLVNCGCEEFMAKKIGDFFEFRLEDGEENAEQDN